LPLLLLPSLSLSPLLRRSLTAAAGHLGTVLRHVWERISSQESKEAILGCVLCILNMHKKAPERTGVSLSRPRQTLQTRGEASTRRDVRRPPEPKHSLPTERCVQIHP
uniref:Uncharacterized protein n=1 Tax=Sinocyclocheilus anshuiensis TaxID=1608454 RepID=A0A671LIJ3_9TELE